MAAAIEEVAERGYQGASLTRIAARAGVAKGLVWHYFTDKDDLMESTAKTTMAAMGERVIGALDLEQPVPDIIRAALGQAAAQVGTHRSELIALNLIVRNLEPPGGSERVTGGFYEEIHRGQQELFRRGQAEGSLGDFDTRVMAVTYQGSIDVMVDHLENHPDVDAQEYAAALAEILLNGISAQS